MSTKGLRYFALSNKKASIFYCADSGLKVLSNKPSMVSAVQVRTSKKIQSALRSGFIKEITEGQYNQLINPSSGDSKPEPGILTKELASKMNNDECFTYYVDNYEVSDEEKAAFKALTVSKMREFLVDLEKQATE